MLLFLVVVFAFVCFLCVFFLCFGGGGGAFLSKVTRLLLPDPCAFTFCDFGTKTKLLRQVNIISSNGIIYSAIKGFWFVSCLRPRLLFLSKSGPFYLVKY